MTKINKKLLTAVCATALMASFSSAVQAGGLYVEEGRLVEAYPDSVFEFSNDEVQIELAEPNSVSVQAIPVEAEVIVERVAQPVTTTTTTYTTETVSQPVVSEVVVSAPVVTETVVVEQPVVETRTVEIERAVPAQATYSYQPQVTGDSNVQYRDNLSHYDQRAPILSQEIITHEYECCDGEFVEEYVTKTIPGERRPVQKVITKMVPQAPVEVEDVVTEYVAQPDLEYHEVIVYRVPQEPKAVQKVVKRLVEQPAREVQEVITEYVETPARQVQEVIRRAAPKKVVQYEEIVTHQIKPVGVTRTIPVQSAPVVTQSYVAPQPAPTYSCTIDANGNPILADHNM